MIFSKLVRRLHERLYKIWFEFPYLLNLGGFSIYLLRQVFKFSVDFKSKLARS